MSLDKLDYIIAVAEAQTLTRAAQQLYVSQPTLTNYINKLEESLGIKLFDRTVTPIQVTQAGALYISRMKKIQREADILHSELRNMAQKQLVFHLGIGSTRGNHWLPKIVPYFLEKHSDIHLEFHEQGEEALENGLQNGTIDLAFGVLNAGFPDLTYEPIIDEPVFLVIPRSYECVAHLEPHQGTMKAPYRIAPEEVGSLPFLLPYAGNGFHRTAQHLLTQAGIVPMRAVYYRNMDTAYQLSAMGVGALFATTAIFEARYPQCGEKLALCSLDAQPCVRTCVAGYRAENKKITLIQDMIAVTQDYLVPHLRSFQ